ncbi:pilin [Pseudoxanthomonas sp.]|uniref:pilin n=1 Tax=Pseudoxanthomonas sp. TaxID=1871049 RepID=UPI003F7F479C
MKKNMQGFSLIELMITVAIIAILTAIAVPIYQNYTIKTQATAALAEIAPGKTGYELALANGKTPSLDADNPGYINIKVGTYCSAITLTGGIKCTTKGGAAEFAPKALNLVRSDSGEWKCETDIEEKYRPAGCGAVGGNGGGGNGG